MEAPESTEAIAPISSRKRKASEDFISENESTELVKHEHDEECQTNSFPECSIEEVEEINTAENGESIDIMPLALENGGVPELNIAALEEIDTTESIVTFKEEISELAPETQSEFEFFVPSDSGFEIDRCLVSHNDALLILINSTKHLKGYLIRGRQRSGLDFGKFRAPGRSRDDEPGSGIPAIPELLRIY